MELYLFSWGKKCKTELENIGRGGSKEAVKIHLAFSKCSTHLLPAF
jgi:hypothetical protein